MRHAACERYVHCIFLGAHNNLLQGMQWTDRRTDREERTKTKRQCDNDKAQQEVQEVKWNNSTWHANLSSCPRCRSCGYTGNRTENWTQPGSEEREEPLEAVALPLCLLHLSLSLSLLFQSVGLSSAIALLVWHFGLSDNANRSIAQCSPCQCLLCGSRNSPARLLPDFRPCTCPCPYATTPQKGSILKINRLPKITCRTSGYWTRRI